MSVNGSDSKIYGKKYEATARLPDVEELTVTINNVTYDKSTAGITGYTISGILNPIQTTRTLGGILYHQSAPDVKKFSLTFVCGSTVHFAMNDLLMRRISNTASMFNIVINDGAGQIYTMKDCLLDNISDITGSIDSFGEQTANFIAKECTLKQADN